MSGDLFERLVEKDVPPVPENLERQVHVRLNRILVGVHVAEFVFQVLPHAAVHFLKAMGEACLFTLSGRYSGERTPPRREP